MTAKLDDRKLDQAAGMWAEGKAAWIIASSMGVSASTFDGWRTRYRQRFPIRPRVQTARTPSQARRPEPTPCEMPPQTAVATEEQQEERRDTPTFAPLPGTSPKPMMETTGCRWPIHPDGEDARRVPQLFCDAPTTTRRDRHGNLKPCSWCETHYERAFSNGTPSERAALRDGKRLADREAA